MKGALVFLGVFALIFFISLGVTSIPPGQQIYDALNLPAETTTYLVGGAIYADVLIIAIFNGVIYGFIVWLVFTILMYVFKKDKSQNVQQNVTVNVEGNKEPQVTGK